MITTPRAPPGPQKKNVPNPLVSGNDSRLHISRLLLRCRDSINVHGDVIRRLLVDLVAGIVLLELGVADNLGHLGKAVGKVPDVGVVAIAKGEVRVLAPRDDDGLLVHVEDLAPEGAVLDGEANRELDLVELLAGGGALGHLLLGELVLLKLCLGNVERGDGAGGGLLLEADLDFLDRGLVRLEEVGPASDLADLALLHVPEDPRLALGEVDVDVLAASEDDGLGCLLDVDELAADVLVLDLGAKLESDLAEGALILEGVRDLRVAIKLVRDKPDATLALERDAEALRGYGLRRSRGGQGAGGGNGGEEDHRVLHFERLKIDGRENYSD